MKSKFSVPVIGLPKISSPIQYDHGNDTSMIQFVNDLERIHYNVSYNPDESEERTDLLELAGPRAQIFFTPKHVHAGIITCGGLCPGLNDVIRSLTRCLWYSYGVKRISGIRYGFFGFMPESSFSTVALTPEIVDDIHRIGGSMLGSSRGAGDRTEEIVDEMERLNLNILFVIGGDGTQKGALAICNEIERRNLKISVIGIPKTIDNDLSYIDKSFGFETAVAEATKVIYAAHSEAHSAINGVGLVKLMGRKSGFIAAHTALASNEVNFVLIPEVPFDLEGENGFLHHLRLRLQRRQHAVVVVAEGAGHHFLPASDKKDASGNVLFQNIGMYLKDAIIQYFQSSDFPVHVKYIDPSYLIRGAVAEPNDSRYCSRLAHNAVHAAMAGKTKMVVSLIHHHYVHIPMEASVSRRNHVDPSGSLWRDVIEATHQPALMTNKV